jgi:hypothetical protein
MTDTIIHYVKILDIIDAYNEDTEEYEMGFKLNDCFYSLNDCMRLSGKDDYYDGYYGETYFSSLLIKILSCDQVAVSLVTC